MSLSYKPYGKHQTTLYSISHAISRKHQIAVLHQLLIDGQIIKTKYFKHLPTPFNRRVTCDIYPLTKPQVIKQATDLLQQYEKRSFLYRLLYFFKAATQLHKLTSNSSTGVSQPIESRESKEH